jgi:predicted phage replisome organizer
MSDNKKYYYLKLVDNFYERDEMIILESMPDGYMYSNILLKLYLRSLKNEGKLMFNNRIPYNASMLANVTRFPVAVVEKAIAIFKELGLIEVLDNGAIYMLDIQNFIGKSSTEADRKRLYRSKIEEEKKSLGQMSGQLIGQMSGQLIGQMSDKTPPEIDIDIEKELEKDIDIHTDKEKEDKYVDKSDLKTFKNLYEQNIGLINGITAEYLIELSETIDVNLFKRAIEIATDKGKCNLGYIKGIIKQWLDANIRTLEQLEAYKLQQEQSKQKGVKTNGSSTKRTKQFEQQIPVDDEKDEEYYRLLKECERLSRE